MVGRSLAFPACACFGCMTSRCQKVSGSWGEVQLCGLYFLACRYGARKQLLKIQDLVFTAQEDAGFAFLLWKRCTFFRLKFLVASAFHYANIKNRESVSWNDILKSRKRIYQHLIFLKICLAREHPPWLVFDFVFPFHHTPWKSEFCSVSKMHLAVWG